jgi:hypothetical protein
MEECKIAFHPKYKGLKKALTELLDLLNRNLHNKKMLFKGFMVSILN